uniref:NADH dehydrogenase subunit 4L n=1 Tax=Amyrsidea minuta TaxID=2364307 RepID=A0A386B2C1_9NEOP|nr:NADH dehydrogenase subunit 4L [Amyrsidea minuta]
MEVIVYFLVLISLIKTFSTYKAINVLLSMEFLFFSNILVASVTAYFIFYVSSLIIFLMFIMVSESIMGLSLLVKMMSIEGNSKLNSYLKLN